MSSIDPGRREQQLGDWDLVANHGLVLSCIARQKQITARQIANTIGVTERTAHKIITDLISAAYLKKERIGRRNVYSIDMSKPLRHPSFQAQKPDGARTSVGDFLQAIGAISGYSKVEEHNAPNTRIGLGRIFRRESKS